METGKIEENSSLSTVFFCRCLFCYLNPPQCSTGVLLKQVTPILSLPVIFQILWKTMLQATNTSSLEFMLAQSKNYYTSLDHLQPSGWSSRNLNRPRTDHAPPPRAWTVPGALFSNFALKYATVFNSQLLSASLAVPVQQCRVCLTFPKRYCSKGKRLSWPHSVISGTLPDRYGVVHSAGFITSEADTHVVR